MLTDPFVALMPLCSLVARLFSADDLDVFLHDLDGFPIELLPTGAPHLTRCRVATLILEDGGFLRPEFFDALLREWPHQSQAIDDCRDYVLSMSADRLASSYVCDKLEDTVKLVSKVAEAWSRLPPSCQVDWLLDPQFLALADGSGGIDVRFIGIDAVRLGRTPAIPPVDLTTTERRIQVARTLSDAIDASPVQSLAKLFIELSSSDGQAEQPHPATKIDAIKHSSVRRVLRSAFERGTSELSIQDFRERLEIAAGTPEPSTADRVIAGALLLFVISFALLSRNKGLMHAPSLVAYFQVFAALWCALATTLYFLTHTQRIRLDARGVEAWIERLRLSGTDLSSSLRSALTLAKISFRAIYGVTTRSQITTSLVIGTAVTLLAAFIVGYRQSHIDDLAIEELVDIEQSEEEFAQARIAQEVESICAHLASPLCASFYLPNRVFNYDATRSVCNAKTTLTYGGPEGGQYPEFVNQTSICHFVRQTWREQDLRINRRIADHPRSEDLRLLRLVDFKADGGGISWLWLVGLFFVNTLCDAVAVTYVRSWLDEESDNLQDVLRSSSLMLAATSCLFVIAYTSYGVVFLGLPRFLVASLSLSLMFMLWLPNEHGERRGGGPENEGGNKYLLLFILSMSFASAVTTMIQLAYTEHWPLVETLALVVVGLGQFKPLLLLILAGTTMPAVALTMSALILWWLLLRLNNPTRVLWRLFFWITTDASMLRLSPSIALITGCAALLAALFCILLV